MNKILKKVISSTLAAVSVVGGAVAFSGCTTDHPEVEMQLAFNGKTYTLEYKLYRKKAPNTVNHFLALVENGYYNPKDGKQICIHDYTDSKWYTGAYAYDENNEENGGLSYRDYFSIVSAYENKDFVSVWKDEQKTTPTYTLYGEFSENGVKMDKGDFLAESFGSLSMYYESTGENAEEYKVFVNRVDGGETRTLQYEKNNATSMFAINLTGSGMDKNHAVFATLDEDSVDELNDLKSAIESYIKANFSDDEDAAERFTESVEIHYGAGDPFIAESELTVEYDVPTSPIVIKNVKVLKY